MSKIDLPPLPKGVSPDQGIGKAMLAYAEQAVREALEAAAQSLEPMAQEAFERPGVAGTVHMAYHQAIAAIRALIPENSHE